MECCRIITEIIIIIINYKLVTAFVAEWSMSQGEETEYISV